jgi:hypothetical protein
MARRCSQTAFLALLVALWGLAPAGAQAQESPRFVQGPDGTVYLLSNGARYTVTPVDPISDEDLEAIPDGGDIAGQLNQPAAAAAPAPEPGPAGEAPRPAPVPATGPVQILSALGRVNSTASVIALAAPGAPCSLTYTPPAGSPGLPDTVRPALAGDTGVVQWTWTLVPSTSTGDGSVTVTCRDASDTRPIPLTFP